MSRLYPLFAPGFPGGDPFGPLSPFLRFPAREPTINEMLPRLSPEEEKSYLGQTLEGGLGGLAYLGKIADKTFGARAVRGLLGGKPQELASVLPLSDSLGLTQESNTVSGRSLLADAGLLSRDSDPQSFGLGDAAGLAAEVALDPSTYLTGGLTAAGKAAKLAGGLKGLSKAERIGGYVAREGDLANIARTMGSQVGRTAGAQLGRGIEPTDVLRQLGLSGPILSSDVEATARAAGQRIEPQYLPVGNALTKNPAGATSLSGLFGLAPPFSSNSLPIGTGQLGLDTLALLKDNMATRLATAPFRGADSLVQKATGFSPLGAVGNAGGALLRAGGALFDPPAKDAWSLGGQDIGRNVVTPLEQQLKRDSLGAYADFANDLKPLFNGTARDQTLSNALHQMLEQPTLKIPMRPFDTPDADLLPSLFNPAELGQINSVVGKARSSYDSLIPRTAKFGVNETPLESQYGINYATRRSTDIKGADTGADIADYLTPEANKMVARHGSLTQRNKIFDVPGGTTQINRWFKDPRMSGPNATLTPAEIERDIRRELTGVNTPLKDSPAWEQAKELRKTLAKLDPKFAEKGVDFFNMDLASNLLLRHTRADRAETAARATLEAIARYAKPEADILAAGGKAHPVEKLMNQMGLVGRDPGSNVSIAAEIAANKLGVNLDDLKGMAVPAELARDIVNMNEMYTNPVALKPVIDSLDWVNRLFKTSLTRPFPGFHTRNLVSGVYNMLRGGAFKTPQELKNVGGRAQAFLKGKGINSPAFASDGQLWKELVQAGILNRNTGPNADVVGAAGEVVRAGIRRPINNGQSTWRDIGETILGGIDPRKIGKGNLPETIEEFAPIAAGNKVGQMAEDWLRTAHYVAKREQGFSAAAAAEEVAKYQLDYGDLTRFEKAVGRRVLPFYAFSRRNLPPLLADLADQPGAITAPLRAVTGGRTRGEFVPSYLAEGASLPIPGGPEGNQRYISSFGLPIEDESLKTIGSFAQGDFQRGIGSLIGSSFPYLKSPLEVATNRSLYSGRPLEELQPYQWAKAGGLLDEQQARLLSEVIAGTPASRVASTVDKITDDRKGIAPKAINLLSGIRISDVDVLKARDSEAKRVLADVLRGQPGVKSSSEVYIPRDRISGISPEQAIIYRLMLSADERIRQEAQRRREVK